MRWWMWLIVAVISLRYGWYVLPHAGIYYSEDASQEVRLIWNDNGRISESRIQPGGFTNEVFDIYRDADYYVALKWWQPKGGRYNCTRITPNWPRTVIYLDENADIDYSKGTDAELISKCPNDWADM